MKLDEVKSTIQGLVEKNHKLDIEFKNKDQTLNNKER
jgi:regulator of replication initiation timing